MLNYILTNNTLTVFANGKIRTITDTAKTWEKTLTALRANDETAVIEAMDAAIAINKFGATHEIAVVSGQVYWKGKELHNSITKRIIKMIEEGFDAAPMVAFLTNVMQNPSNRAIEELYGFLENNNLPITPTGNFIAYKRINRDWTDVYTGTISNHVGATPSMPRNMVNDDCTQTCSHGLHVCSLEYLKHFSGSRLIAVEVNPKDVVSVPIDYHNTKMRVSEYTVIEELDMALIEQIDRDWKAVFDDEDGE